MLILRDINVPETRWRYKQGDVDLRMPVHQHLYSKDWDQGAYVQKVLQRLFTMKVIPDSLPSFHPKLEFRVRFHEGKVPSRVHVRRHGWRDTQVGEKLSSMILMNAPRMEIIPHYREWWQTRKYAVVMLDLGTLRSLEGRWLI